MATKKAHFGPGKPKKYSDEEKLKHDIALEGGSLANNVRLICAFGCEQNPQKTIQKLETRDDHLKTSSTGSVNGVRWAYVFPPVAELARGTAFTEPALSPKTVFWLMRAVGSLGAAQEGKKRRYLVSLAHWMKFCKV